MKTNKIITTILILSMLPVLILAQTKQIRGTYIYSDNEEYIQISKSTFKIIRTQLCTSCVNLNKGDSIASFGSVEYIQDNFIRLRSDRDSSIYKSMTIEESNDASIKDSVKIRFVFPFKGKYRIDASLIGIPPLSVEKKCITIPREKFTLDPLAFEIYNMDLKYNGHYGEFFGRVAFCNSPLYQFKNKNTNSLLINIPELTNSYFARYFIDGEYVRVETDKIIWRNREYRKISDELITPKIELGEQALDDINGVDWVDK
jgi:hypothetical protein